MIQFETGALLTGAICLVISAAAAIWASVCQTRASTNGYLKAARALRSIHLITLSAALIAITISLTVRALYTGHGPFSSMYEFAVAFAWGILGMTLFFGRLYKLPVNGIIGVIMALALLIFAFSLSSKAAPLVPALQQSLLLSTHVASAIVSYGALTVAFGAAVTYLIKAQNARDIEGLDRLSYHAVIIGFSFLTLVIVLGAVWADIAWGRFWGWDPKETASLVTWLLYASYLHARITRGWRGKKAAILLIAGFAAVLITFFGNYVFKGLHAYT